MDLPKTVFFFNPISRHIPTSKVMDESRKATAYIDPKFTVQPRACSRKKAFAAARSNRARELENLAKSSLLQHSNSRFGSFYGQWYDPK